MRNKILSTIPRAVKTTVSLEILWGPFKLMMHVASLRHWNDAGPGDYFGYPFVVVEWVSRLLSPFHNSCRNLRYI